MNFIFRYKQLIVGMLLGGWIVFFLVRSIIFQEFNGLESVGNATYVQLRNEALDDFLLVPMFLMLPVTAIALIALAVSGKCAKKKTQKHV